MSERKNVWDISPDELSLSGLEIPHPRPDGSSFQERQAKRDAQMAEYKRKYGADWFRRYARDMNGTPDYDSAMKRVNTCIYRGAYLEVSGIGERASRLRRLMRERPRELYGDRYDELERHPYGDPRVAELLLQDAIRTGKWKELPDELQSEYHRRVGDAS